MKYLKTFEVNSEKFYIRYEIQSRKWSPNVLIGVYKDEKGKECKEIILCPTIDKESGDKSILKIKNFLEKK